GHCDNLKASSNFRRDMLMQGAPGPKLVVVMVGLPARGKSYIVKKLKRYLTWLQYDTKIFNVGNIRRNSNATKRLLEVPERLGQTRHSAAFFDPDNNDARNLRDKMALECLDELIDWMNSGGRVGIHDATNSTVKRRKLILDHIQKNLSCKVLFVESICNDKKTVEANMRLKLSGPDYKNMDPDEALDDFRKRVVNYEKAYEPISEEEEQTDMQYCKLINVGKKVIAHNIQGYLSGQCIFYLMNFNLVAVQITERQIWLTRHGESTDNIIGRIGGNACLSARGRRFAECLAKFISKQKIAFRQQQLAKYKADVEAELQSDPLAIPASEPPEKSFHVWTSLLQRTIDTVEHIDPKEFGIMHIRFLNEIYAGLYEEMTYREIEQLYPKEYNARKNNKLYYRYPGMGGESYLDVIHRVNPLIVELERMTDNILIVTHQVVLRIILAYFLDVDKEHVPDMPVPLHTIYCLEPKPYGTKLTKWKYDEDTNWFLEEE
ncbi:11130_t:CDS:10, partial [Paraglomus occultum]